MSLAAVLPRVRARKRRRRPMTPRERHALRYFVGMTICVVVNVSEIAACSDVVLRVWDLGVGCLAAICARHFWWPVANYLRNGWLDD